MTYPALEDRIARLAGVLRHSLQIGIGDRVSFLGDNCPEIVELLFACARVGAIFVPLNAHMTAEQHNVYLDNAQPRFLFVEGRYLDTARDCTVGRPSLRLVSFGPVAPGNDDIDRLAPLIEAATPVASGTDLPFSTPLLMAYTSGTTGNPKGAVLSQESLYYSALNSIDMFEMTARDKVLTIVPMYHIGGISIHTIPAMRVGATVTIHRELDPALVLRDIERYRITLIVGRPPVARAISSHGDWDRTDLSSMRSYSSGTTRVPLEVMAPWFARGVPVQQLYGITEALPPVIAVSIADARRKAGSIGKPAAHVEARVVDHNMRDVPPGDRGEIILRSKCVLTNYWRNEGATTDSFHDGWFRTGDVGHQDDDGYFYIDDRIKDIVIVGASNVYPADGERILAECDAIEEAAIVGKPHPNLGESLVACVVLKQGRSMDARELRALFKGRLASYQHPHDILFMESIPRTPLGKIQKSALRQLVRELPGDTAGAALSL